MAKIKPMFLGVISRFCDKFRVRNKWSIFVLRLVFILALSSDPIISIVYITMYFVINESEKKINAKDLGRGN